MAATVHVDARYTADTTQYVRQVQAAQRATANFAKAMPEADRSMADVKASTVALGSALGMLGAQALTKATAKVKQFAMQGVNAAKDYEQTVISIEGIFAGMGMSVQEATDKTQSYLAELRDFAAKTPFELPQTLTAVKRLLSIGYAADDVKDRLLPTIGDIVSALGQPPQSISAVVYAFGQMKSAGRVLTQDLMQIGNALPGFNAKMAIATEMFEGDMTAFQAAMEKGAINSEEAIDAILSAMQKFGGAQGAMIRQSETLAGVMSTFSDTVNNALIDGLMPSIPVLSATLNEVMPAVEDMATAFAQSLGPALIDGAKIMGNLAPTISELIPPVIELVSELTVMADVFVAFTPVLEAAAQMAGLLASGLQMLPTPVFVLVGSILVLRMAMKKLKIESMGSLGSMSRQFKIAARKVQIDAATMGTSLTTTQIRFQTLALTGRMAMMGLVTSLRAAGAAVKAFMASLGPVGIAFAAVAVAMEVFMGKSAATETLIAKLRDTADEATEAINGLSIAAMAEQLRTDISSEDIAKLEAAGLSIQDMAVAALEGGDAVDEMERRILELRDSFGFFDTFNPFGDSNMYENVRRNFSGAAEAAEGAIKANKDADDAARDAAAAAQEQAWKTGEAVKALENYRDAGVRAAVVSGQLDGNFDGIAAGAEELADEVQKVSGQFDYLLGTLSKIEAVDNSAAAMRDLKEAAKEGGDALLGQGKKAQEFRSKFSSAIEASIAKAETLGDTLPEQRRIMQGEFVKIVQTLRDSGIKDKDVAAFLGTFDQLPMSVDQILNAASIVAGEETDTLVTEIQKSVRKSFKRGEIATADAAARMAEAAAEEANAAMGVNMPDELTSALDQVGAQVTPVMRAEGYDLGRSINLGLAAGVRENANYVDAAIRAMAMAGVQEAKDILGIASPSKVFLEIGEDLVKGLELGVVRGAPGFTDAMARMWQDAKWAAEDARDRVVAAEKALKEARDEGNAREVASAERDLARARRDAIDAAKAARQAEKDLAAVRELASMPFGKGALKFWDELAKSIADTGDLDAAFASVEDFLMRRARNAGLSAEAAAEYVSTTLNKFYEATEKDQRRLNRLTGRLENVRDRIEKVRREIEERAAERESARAEFGSFFESLFGEESDFEQAYDAYAITVDKAADLFKDLDDLIEQRFTGAKDEAERDRLTAFLEDQTKQLVSLIKRRDVLAQQLRDGEATLRAMVDERDRAEERLRDSITSFFKPSAGITSADEYITGLQQRVDATRQYMADIDALRKRGVGASTIEQILSMGPEAGGSLANVLANATDEQLEYVNALTAQSETMASSFGETQAEIMYGAGVKAQQELVEGLRSEYDTVIGEIETIVKAIGDELKPLADESYDVGELMGQQLLDGLLDKEAEIVAEIETIGNRIARAWAQALGMSWSPSGGASGRGMIATPTAVPTTVGGGVQMSFGEIKVEVNVGDGQNAGNVRSAVSSGVTDALRQVAQRVSNARR